MPRLLPLGAGATVERHLTPEPERQLPQDPVAFVRDELDEHVWSKPRAIMRSVVEHRHTAVRAGHDVSKSWTASRLAAWWIAAHPVGEAFVVTSAPTETQVKAILWREIGRAHRRGNLPGRITLNAQWYVGPRGGEELIAFGRKPQDLVDKEAAMQAFSGIHAQYVLVILDEAMGIPAWLWDAAESLATNEASRILAIGNPDSTTGRFLEVCKPGSGWNVIHVSVFDSPNFTGEPVPEYVRQVLVSKAWEAERRERWGTENALYQSKVLGEFPDTSDDTVITPALIRAAQDRELPGSEKGAFGLDVARFGSDASELYRDRGGVIRHVQSWRKQSTTDTRLAVMAHTRRLPEVPIGVDADGLGAGVYDELRHAGVRAVPFTAAGKVHAPTRFANRRSELWWAFREEMEEGLIDLDEADEDLAAQLQQPKWQMDVRGRIVVETKDEMRKRGLPSPDKADAAIIARHTARTPSATAGRTLGAPDKKRPVTAGLMRRAM